MDAHEPARGLSLWLSPPEAEAAPWRALILELSRRLGAPSFEPHVTLLGGFDPTPDAEEESARLAARLPPWSLHVAGASGEPTFYRCLYAAVSTTPDLAAAHAAARSLFAGAPEGAFRPHVSLAYGRLDPRAQGALSAELGPRLPPSFLARHLDLVRTEGVPSEWVLLRRFDLGRGIRVG